MLTALPSGLIIVGTVPSAFSNTKLLKPPAERAPPGRTISSTFTVMVAVAFVEDANTVRAIPECGAIVTSTVVSGTGSGTGRGFGAAVKEALPPTGWLGIERRNDFSRFVKFCTVMANARCSVLLNGFEF